jgi:hypothetical protein
MVIAIVAVILVVGVIIPLAIVPSRMAKQPKDLRRGIETVDLESTAAEDQMKDSNEKQSVPKEHLSDDRRAQGH